MRDATAEVVDELAERQADAGLVDAGVFHVTAHAEQAAASVAQVMQLLTKMETDDGRGTISTQEISYEGGLYAPDLAALALRQAEGDMAEAAFMVRAYRSTLPRLGYTLPVRGDETLTVRRISSTFRDMHAELDHLVKVVFPALRERLAPSRVYLLEAPRLSSSPALDVGLRVRP